MKEDRTTTLHKQKSRDNDSSNTEKLQLILFQFKPDGNRTFVDFIIVINPSFTEKRFKNVVNSLGKDQKNSGLDMAPSFIQGDCICPFKRTWKTSLAFIHTNWISNKSRLKHSKKFYISLFKLKEMPNLLAIKVEGFKIFSYAS